MSERARQDYLKATHGITMASVIRGHRELFPTPRVLLVRELRRYRGLGNLTVGMMYRWERGVMKPQRRYVEAVCSGLARRMNRLLSPGSAARPSRKARE